MSITPTYAALSVPARPCAVPTAAVATIARPSTARTWSLDPQLTTFGEGHMGMHNGTNGSKRPNPGHLDEVST